MMDPSPRPSMRPPSSSTTASARSGAPTHAPSHRRKISFADLERTFRNAGPMPAPAAAHAQHAQLTAQQQHVANLEAQRRLEMFRRQSKKPTDREIPDDIAEVTIGDGVDRYRKLRDVERRLDAIMMRKRLDINENAQRRYARREGVLRIAISNTAEGQPWQIMEEGNGHEDGIFELGDNPASYRVKIEGRLLEDPTEDEADRPDPAHRPRLSDFFKSITVDFDRPPSVQPDGFSQIEWRKPSGRDKNSEANSSEANFDTLEFERKAEESIDVTINLVRDEQFERCKLSPLLADILDTDENDKSGVVQGIWDYCRANGLQEDDDKRKIVCDEPLRKVCLSMFSEAEDLSLTHTLFSCSTKTRSTFPSSRTCWALT